VDFCLQLLSEYVILERPGEGVTVDEYFSSQMAFLNYGRDREIVLLYFRISFRLSTFFPPPSILVACLAN
jgi:hypothetical protein